MRVEAGARRRNLAVKSIAAVAVLIVIMTALVVSTPLGRALASTVYPRNPESTTDLRFAGFIHLPVAKNAGLLSVMDYMNVQGRELFVASIRPGAVFKIPLDIGSLPRPSDIGILEGEPSAHGIVIDSSGRFGFASRSGVGSVVDVFDPRTMRLLKRIDAVSGADGIFMDPVNRVVYVSGGEGRAASLIDPGLRAAVGEIHLPGQPEFAVFDPVRRALMQNLFDRNAIAVVDLKAGTVVDVWPLAGCVGPSGIALDAMNRRLMVACQTNGVLLIIDADTHAVVAMIGIGDGADSVIYDPGLKRIYTAGLSGVLSTIEQRDAMKYEKKADIALAFGAHTLSVDEVTHRVYAGYASFLSGPRLAVFDAL